MRQWAALACLLVLVGAGSCQKKELDPAGRIDRLGHELRCPVCRGVPIAESPATLALQMMEVVRQQVNEGKSDEEILQYFEERYGEWALLEPKPAGMNLVIWIFPAVFILGGVGVILFQVKKRTGR